MILPPVFPYLEATCSLSRAIRRRYDRRMRGDMGMRARILVSCLTAAALASCSPSASSASGKLSVLTTVSPITDIVRHVAGGDADVTGVIPEGVDSHTFEPTPDTARQMADADVILVNGLHL